MLGSLNNINMEENQINKEKKLYTYDSVVKSISELHAAKAADYGPSVHTAFEEFGPISVVVRLHDKLSRLKTLIKNKGERQVKDESLIDTALDMANYSIMLAVELLNHETV
jgi:hypothetical protein